MGKSSRKKKLSKKKLLSGKKKQKDRSVDTSEEDVFALKTQTTVDESEKKGSSLTTVLDATIEERSVEYSPKLKKLESREKQSQHALSQVVIPPTYFSVVDVDYEIPKGYREVEATTVFTLSLVVVFISQFSPFFSFLVVGDQILEVNGTPVLTLAEFQRKICNENSGKLRVVRPWNVTNLRDRMPKKRNKNCNYSVVEIHRFPGKGRGLEADIGRNGLVRNIKPAQNGAHGFFNKDRIVDVDSVPIKSMSKSEVRESIEQSFQQKQRCSFVVERAATLRSSPNASLAAARVENPPSVVMGDDACEIGAREATRVREMRDRYRPKPITKVLTNSKKNSAEPTRTVTDDEGEKKRRSSTKKKKGRKPVSIGVDRNVTSQTPSDVKDPSKLITVSGLNRSFLNSVREKFQSSRRS